MIPGRLFIRAKPDLVRPRQLHAWDLSSAEAIAVQLQLRDQVIRCDDFGEIKTVAGADIGIRGSRATAAVAVLSYPSLTIVDQSVVKTSVQFPYIPGLLSFREIPPLLQAFEQLRTIPDLIILDGHGMAHPRRFGLASHLGFILNWPTIGCAKSRLSGTYQEPEPEKGSYRFLHDRDQNVIGAAVRTRSQTKVIFVSAGHRVSLDSAIRLTLACCPRYKLPETTRYAHRLASS